MTGMSYDVTLFNTKPSADFTGKRVRQGSLVRIEPGYGVWSMSSIGEKYNAEFEGQTGRVQTWWVYDGETELHVVVGVESVEGLTVPARYATVVEY